MCSALLKQTPSEGSFNQKQWKKWMPHNQEGPAFPLTSLKVACAKDAFTKLEQEAEGRYIHPSRQKLAKTKKLAHTKT